MSATILIIKTKKNSASERKGISTNPIKTSLLSLKTISDTRFIIPLLNRLLNETFFAGIGEGSNQMIEGGEGFLISI